MANSTAAYKYRPLCPSSDEIRLLTLDPGLDDDEISCTLNHHNLTNNPKYEALSYTWGDATNEGRITVDGRPFVVSANLETALRYLRYPVPSSVPGTEIPPPNNEPCGKRTIWIDAICVDQENSKERSQQIRKMDKIFGSALKVLAWLGSARDESDSAMDFVKRIANGLGLFGVDGEPLIPENTWIALQKLWARPYWERVWIIQELAAAMVKGEMQFLPRYRAEVGCGRMWVPLDDFQLAWDRLNFYINISGLGVDDRTDPARHLFELLLQHSQKGHTLSSLISLTYTAKATDNRDHFYAVLGLAPEADREDLYPDYAKLFPEINGRFLKRIIEKEMKLDILAFDHSSQAPTWAPNFESISRSARIRWRKYWGGFQASGRLVLSQPHVRFSDDWTTLTIKGFVVDTVVTVDGPFEDAEDFINNSRHVVKHSVVRNAIQTYRSTIIRRKEHRRQWELEWKQQWKQQWGEFWEQPAWKRKERKLQWVQFWTQQREPFWELGRKSQWEKRWGKRWEKQLEQWEQQWGQQWEERWEQQLKQCEQQWKETWGHWKSRWEQAWWLYQIRECVDILDFGLGEGWGEEWVKWGEWWEWCQYQMKECVDIPDFGLGEGWGEKWEKWGEWWQGERPEQREEWERWKRWKQWEQEWEQEWEKQRDEHPWRVIHPQYEENPLVAVGRTLLIDHHLEKSPPIAKRGTPDSFSSFYRLLLDPRNQYLESGVQDITNVGLNKEERQRFNLALRQALEGRCFFTTRSGYIGVGPRGTCPGHRVAILSGGNMPFIIKGEGPSLHSLIGEAYVHGIMDRELRIPWGKLHDIHLI